jgi:integrase
LDADHPSNGVLFPRRNTLRRRNIIALTIGESIVRHQHGYEIRFPACAVKNSRAISMMLMTELIHILDRYIESYRPLLWAGGEDISRALWVSNLARRLASNSMNAAFRRITSEILGSQVNPHSLRHSAATAILIQDPLATGMASATLAHGSEATLDRYYDLSGNAAAQALWCKLSRKYRAHAKGGGRSGMPQGRQARSGTTGF